MEKFEIVTFYWALEHVRISEHSTACAENGKKLRRFTHIYILRLIRKTTSLFSLRTTQTSPPPSYMPDYSSYLQTLTPLWKLQKLLAWETSLGKHLNIFHHLEHHQLTALLNPFAVAFLFLTSPASLQMFLHLSPSPCPQPVPPLLLLFFPPEHLLRCFWFFLFSHWYLPGGHSLWWSSPTFTLLYNSSSSRLMALYWHKGPLTYKNPSN